MGPFPFKKRECPPPPLPQKICFTKGFLPLVFLVAKGGRRDGAGGVPAPRSPPGVAGRGGLLFLFGLKRYPQVSKVYHFVPEVFQEIVYVSGENRLAVFFQKLYGHCVLVVYQAVFLMFPSFGAVEIHVAPLTIPADGEFVSRCQFAHWAFLNPCRTGRSIPHR